MSLHSSSRAVSFCVCRRAGNRSFSVSATGQKNAAAVPSFPETSSPQLDEVLLQLRTKHFIPAYLNKRQRHLIFGDKFKTELQNNPAYATLGDEEIALVHIDRTREIPARKPLVLQALGLIEENDEWNQLPSLLEGLHKAHPDSDPALQEKILRKLQQADQFSVILRCLRRSETTGLTLKKDAVLNRVLLALRETALGEKWEQERLEKALRHADELAELLESAQHGTMRQLSPNDPRTRPAVIGLFLELHAVYASQCQGGQDVKGKVRAYAQRFMACFDHANQPPEQELPSVGPPLEFLSKMSIYHALLLATKILGSDMPDAQRANQIIQNYEPRLNTLAEALSARKPHSNSFAASSLRQWAACVA